jgi:hypothetical protein
MSAPKYFGGVRSSMAKARTRVKKSEPPPDSRAKSTEEMQRVQNRVRNVILDNSVEMARRVVQSVTESGQITSLKFLWDMAGLFANKKAPEEESPDTLAKILLERMGLDDDDPSDEGGHGDGDVESEE